MGKVCTLNQQQAYKIKTKTKQNKKQQQKTPVLSGQRIGKGEAYQGLNREIHIQWQRWDNSATLVARLEPKQADSFLSHNRRQQACISIHSSDPRRPDVFQPLPTGREPPNNQWLLATYSEAKDNPGQASPGLSPKSPKQTRPGVSHPLPSSRELPKFLGSWPSINRRMWPRVGVSLSQKHHQR